MTVDMKRTVTAIPGDGVGPEVMAATRRVIDAAGASIVWESAEAGAVVFEKGVATGVPVETIDSISRNRIVLKGPLATPVGFGEKSANVTLRKLFETYANIRPIREFEGVPTAYSGRGIDLVVVRENVEDLYAGIEHMQTPNVAQCLKLISGLGCERIVRLAFAFAQSEGRSKITCATKANIMKQTEGLLKRTFERISPEFQAITAEHMIVDNCAHQLVRRPEQFDIIVTTNMNGDILSDLTSGLVGGLGFAPSANLGDEVAIFEAVHGSAPKYAGANVINPTAVMLSGVMMLRHLGQHVAADRIEAAITLTWAEGKARTRDVVGNDQPASTSAFTDEVIRNLERVEPGTTRERTPLVMPSVTAEQGRRAITSRKVVGVDIFVESVDAPEALGPRIEAAVEGSALRLKMMSNRGTVVYPSTGAMTSCVDQFRCRFVLRDADAEVQDADIVDALARVGGVTRWMHVEKLQHFDGEKGYTLAQGEI
jgi:isocitrate dehydrogenase